MNYIKNVSAPFPDAICGLTKLENLEIYTFPGLHGPIPSCITKLANLSNVIIRGTSVSGGVPSFSNNTNLNSINLVGNHLSGTIPPSLSTLPNLRFLGLSQNHLTGTIPPGIVSGRSPILWLGHNNLTGEIPKSYGLVDFFYINVEYNQLSGDASFLFGKHKNTTEILLNNNDFEFDLSYVEFSDKLNSLDLSHNKIYGKVPEFIASSTELIYFYVPFNRLCGELPKGFNMWRFSAGDFENNKCLCGDPLPPCFNSAPAPAPAPAPALESTTP
ncbi:polygalacturonase inhibitor 1-like protein [Carex littledalei]|uniref:Polygalacturonase inhibitor 1-like protein n=1 Tax=Carex littledalei TaxID=544730 RepID=A0A833R361_9POAL|nr:polygalacturonase inhibitor 1-like protein [Carex littledalei]